MHLAPDRVDWRVIIPAVIGKRFGCHVELKSPRQLDIYG